MPQPSAETLGKMSFVVARDRSRSGREKSYQKISLISVIRQISSLTLLLSMSQTTTVWQSRHAHWIRIIIYQSCQSCSLKSSRLRMSRMILWFFKALSWFRLLEDFCIAVTKMWLRYQRHLSQSHLFQNCLSPGWFHHFANDSFLPDPGRFSTWHSWFTESSTKA
jgi:hypothetical protein